MKRLLVFISIFICISSIFIATPDVNEQLFHSIEFERKNNRQLPLEMQDARRLNNEFSTDINEIIFEENVLRTAAFITMMSEMLLIEQMNSPITPAVIGTSILIGGSLLGGIISAYQMSHKKDSLDADDEIMTFFGPSMIPPVISSLILSGDPIMTASENKIIGLGGMVGLTIGSLLIGDIIGCQLYRYRNK